MITASTGLSDRPHDRLLAAALASARPNRPLLGLIFRFVDRHAAFDHSRALLPWSNFARDRSPMARLRRLALQLDNAAHGRGAPNAFWAALLYWPVSLRQIAIAFRRYAATTRKTHNHGYTRQLADLLHVAWRLNQPPHDYYLQKMWLRPNRHTWSQYLQQREHVALVKWLGRSLPLAEFDDKYELFRRLRAAGVPTVEVLMAARNGVWLPGHSATPTDPVLRQGLVVKPTDATMREGVEVWFYDPAAGTYTRDIQEKQDGPDRWLGNETLTLPDLLDRVVTLSAGRTFVVQPVVRNVPALEPISPHHVANFRLVTAWRNGRPEVISALVRMGYDTLRWVSSSYQAAIDLPTGVLGKATSRSPVFGYADTHIETGQRVSGVRLESWPEIKSLALRGHALFPWMPTVGWDVVCSADGPQILEANACWGADISQVDAPFLGEVGYAEAFWEAYEHLRQRGGRAVES